MSDFLAALAEVQPAFGANTEGLAKHIMGGIIPYGDAHAHLASTLKTLVSQVRLAGRREACSARRSNAADAARGAVARTAMPHAWSEGCRKLMRGCMCAARARVLRRQVESSEKTPLLSVLLEGPAGSGKTALAASVAIESQFPFVKVTAWRACCARLQRACALPHAQSVHALHALDQQARMPTCARARTIRACPQHVLHACTRVCRQVVSPESMVGFMEQAKGSSISRVFEDAYKSPLSIVILVSRRAAGGLRQRRHSQRARALLQQASQLLATRAGRHLAGCSLKLALLRTLCCVGCGRALRRTTSSGCWSMSPSGRASATLCCRCCAGAAHAHAGAPAGAPAASRRRACAATRRRASTPPDSLPCLRRARCCWCWSRSSRRRGAACWSSAPAAAARCSTAWASAQRSTCSCTCRRCAATRSSRSCSSRTRLSRATCYRRGGGRGGGCCCCC